MRPLQIVIDTNVLIAAYRSNRGASYALLNKLGDSRWEINVSTALVLEYEAILKREFTRQGLDFMLADAVVDYFVSAANLRHITHRLRPILPDPDDDFVLELAVASRAEFIVTYNHRDFINIARYGVESISPRDFLRYLEDRK